MSILNLSDAQIKALNDLPVKEPKGLGMYTAASLSRLVELGLAETKTIKGGETQYVPTNLGKAAKKQLAA